MGRHSAAPVGEDTLRVLFVCHANLCRSPLAEHLGRAQLDGRAVGDGITVASAGTAAAAGTPMDPVALQVLQEQGLDGSGFRTQRLDGDVVRGADLVLAASRRVRATIAELDPDAARRTFTTGELARLARHLGPVELPAGTAPQRLRALIPMAAARRVLVRPSSPGEDDLRDPHGRGLLAMRQCADRLADQTGAWVDLL